MEITFFRNRGLNPVRWTQSPTPYRVTIKAGLYRKAVQVPIPSDSEICFLFSELQGEITLKELPLDPYFFFKH